MQPIITNPPIVKASEVQKNFRKVAEDVQKDGYCFVVNRGNIQIVMVSLPVFKAKIADKQNGGESLFADWKGKKWKTVLAELRAEDNKKPLDKYLKELMQWQKQFLS